MECMSSKWYCQLALWVLFNWQGCFMTYLFGLLVKHRASATAAFSVSCMDQLLEGNNIHREKIQDFQIKHLRSKQKICWPDVISMETCKTGWGWALLRENPSMVLAMAWMSAVCHQALFQEQHLSGHLWGRETEEDQNRCSGRPSTEVWKRRIGPGDKPKSSSWQHLMLLLCQMVQKIVQVSLLLLLLSLAITIIASH